MNRFICIDVGGTSIKYGLSNEIGEFIDKGSVDTEALEKGGPGILEKIKTISKKYIEDNDIDGICISTAGMVDSKKGKVVYALEHLIPEYTGMEIKREVEKEFNIRCEVENDVNCAGLGETWLGAGKNAKSSVCVTVGTGIGGCVILDNKLIHGFSNSAGEIGYIDNMVKSLAIGIANICYLINPEVLILGGGIMAQEEFLKPRIDKALKEILVPRIYENTKIEFAKRQNDAGMIGALYNFLSQI